MLTACTPASQGVPGHPAHTNWAPLEVAFDALGALLGPSGAGGCVMDLASGESWSRNGEIRFPLGRLDEVVIAANLLEAWAKGRHSPERTLQVRTTDLAPGLPDAGARTRNGESASLAALLRRMLLGDACAHDLLLRELGGPGLLTGWLRERRLPGISLDRYGRQLLCEAAGLAPFRPSWADPAVFAQTRQAVSAQARSAAWERFASAKEDGCTPRTAAALVLALEGTQLAPRKDSAALFSLFGDNARSTFPTGGARARLVVLGRPRQASLAGAFRATAGRIESRGGLYAASVFLRGRGLAEADADRLEAKAWAAITQALA